MLILGVSSNLKAFKPVEGRLKKQVLLGTKSFQINHQFIGNNRLYPNFKHLQASPLVRFPQCQPF